MTPPPLVYAAKTPLTELQTSELFVVMSLRLWVSAHLDPTSAGRGWRSGFDAAGLDEAGRGAFAAWLRPVGAARQGPPDVLCAAAASSARMRVGCCSSSACCSADGRA